MALHTVNCEKLPCSTFKLVHSSIGFMSVHIQMEYLVKSITLTILIIVEYIQYTFFSFLFTCCNGFVYSTNRLCKKLKF